MDPNIAKTKLRRAYHGAIAAWWVLLIIIAYTIYSRLFLGTSCMFASTTGIPCPGCGGTRAFVSLLQADIANSLHYHPMLIPSIIIICIYVYIWLTNELIPRKMEATLLTYTVVMIAVYVVRMITMFPRSEPMTFNEQAVIPRLITLLTTITKGLTT